MSKDFKVTFKFHIDEDKAKEWFEDELKLMSKYHEDYLDSEFLPEYIDSYISQTVRKQNAEVYIYSGAFEPIFASILEDKRKKEGGLE